LAQLEVLVGEYMQELGYLPSACHAKEGHSLGMTRQRLIYAAYYEFKQWAKIHTPLSRMMVNYSAILIDK
jgi:hypothetical protein